MTDWANVTITVVPDPCWTPEMEAGAQHWLAVLRHLERKAATEATVSHSGNARRGSGTSHEHSSRCRQF